VPLAADGSTAGDLARLPPATSQAPTRGRRRRPLAGARRRTLRTVY